MIPTIKRCSVAGCDRPVVAKGICELHRSRLRRHGNFDTNLRPADWGDRRKHPLYLYWKQIRRNGIESVEQWHSEFWKFAEAVGERPSPLHNIFRPDKSKPMGPGNAAWSDTKGGPSRAGVSRSDRETWAAYMRDYNRARREADPLLQMRIGLERTHGITMDDYERMMDAQEGVCAICGRAEHRLSTGAARPMRLAVDHEHSTAEIRGLLCSMCNHAIGYLDDSPELLRRAIDYLRDPPARKLGIKHNGKHKTRRVERPASPHVPQIAPGMRHFATLPKGAGEVLGLVATSDGVVVVAAENGVFQVIADGVVKEIKPMTPEAFDAVERRAQAAFAENLQSEPPPS